MAMKLVQGLTQAFRRSGWKEFVLLTAIATLCASVWGFVEIADEVREGESHDIEQQVMRALRRADNPSEPVGPWWLKSVSRDITALGGIAVLTLMTLLVLGYLLLLRAYGAAALVLASTLGGWLLSSGLKTWFARERPSIVPHLTEVASLSFPSGHSTLASAVYLTLGALLARTASRRRAKIYFIHAAAFLAFIIGLSRVHLGVHYPSDVLAGWAVGTAWALICWLAAFWLQKLRTARMLPQGG